MSAYAAAPRKGRVPGSGPEFPSYFEADPLLGWCAECGYPWEADLTQPIADEVASPSAVDRAGAPLDRCKQCSASAEARTGPRVWAEQLYRDLDGDLLGVRYYAHTQDLPPAVTAAFEEGEIAADQLTYWWSTARQRWEELADNPRARWLDDIHAYGVGFAPLSEFLLEHVDEHDPLTCPACIRRQEEHGGLRDWMQEQVRAAVVARAREAEGLSPQPHECRCGHITMGPPLDLDEPLWSQLCESCGRQLEPVVPSDQWHYTGVGAACSQCIEQGHVEPGHTHCVSTERPVELPAKRLTYELQEHSWQWLALCPPAVAAEQGWDAVAS